MPYEQIYGIAEKIEKDRRLYVGDDNLMALKHLIDGYAQCLIDYGIKSKADINRNYIAFEGFVYNALGLKRNGKPLWTIIIEQSKSSNEAYTMFFKLLHAYMSEKE